MKYTWIFFAKWIEFKKDIKAYINLGFSSKMRFARPSNNTVAVVLTASANSFLFGSDKAKWPSNPLNKFLIVQCSLLLFRIIGYLFYYTRAIGNVLYILILTDFEVQYAFCQTWELLPEVVRPKSINRLLREGSTIAFCPRNQTSR